MHHNNIRYVKGQFPSFPAHSFSGIDFEMWCYFQVARQLCVNIAPENLHLPSPLSTVGEYEVPLRLPRSIPLPEGKVNWSLQVKVRSK